MIEREDRTDGEGERRVVSGTDYGEYARSICETEPSAGHPIGRPLALVFWAHFSMKGRIQRRASRTPSHDATRRSDKDLNRVAENDQVAVRNSSP